MIYIQVEVYQILSQVELKATEWREVHLEHLELNTKKTEYITIPKREDKEKNNTP
jgi:hypothetical protein